MFWGGTFIAGKFIAGDVSPVNAAFIRFLAASFFLLIMTRRLEGKLPMVKKHQILPLILLGSTGVFLYNILFFTALHHIHAGKAALIIATNPIIISLLSAFFFKEKLNIVKFMGILLSVTGALIVISNGHITDFVSYGFGMGELCICGCVLTWVAYSLIGKSVMSDLSPVASVCYSSMAGTVLLFFPVFFQGGLSEVFSYSALNWLSLLYLAIFGTVLGFFWYYEGINKIGAMKASVFINFVPISAIVFAYFMLDEPVTPSLFIGGALVISGVYSTNASTLIKKYCQSAGKAICVKPK